MAAAAALIIASSDYQDSDLRRLRAPAQDAERLAGVLADPAIGGFEVKTLLNEPSHLLNLAIEDFFADRHRDDLLLLYVSCHGVKDDDGRLYFAAGNTRLTRLGATAVAAAFVNEQMTRSRSRRIVLLLDCCYSGAFPRGFLARGDKRMDIKERFDGRGRAILTASSAMEYSFEGDQLSGEGMRSVFTSALVEGLETGMADLDLDGRVSVDELYDYVFDKVRDDTPNQTPSKWITDVQGRLYIARAKPRELPADLKRATESRSPDKRAAAVSELARLLEGGATVHSAAARQALERLADDDSRRVSTAAAGALAAAGQRRPEAAAEQAAAEKAAAEQAAPSKRRPRGGKRRPSKRRPSRRRPSRQRPSLRRRPEPGRAGRLGSRWRSVWLSSGCSASASWDCVRCWAEAARTRRRTA